MHRKKTPDLDPAIEKYYSQGKEIHRLDAALIEKDRTLRILKKRMPDTPAVVFDIGGAYGVYSFPLAEMGYEVHLIDPIPIHIQQAHDYSKNFPNVKLASYLVGDARKIDMPTNSADVILFFGPLYHLVQKNDRLQALNEAYRLLKPGGILFASVISRFNSLMDNIYKAAVSSKFQVIKNDLLLGLHPSENSNTLLYFHTPEEVRSELLQTGFSNVSLLGIEGPVWYQSIMGTLQQNVQTWQQLLDLLELIETQESIIGASAHIMAIAKKEA